ncbi:hypothetical protein KUTeg_021833 [Tegillarca granosa]|uniref:Helitron helicase-like domain-containing protein n=1 Tax=Tegillarca granosa TaxID=220873 RepID=A0ABQ9E7J4_TEGGR|nr:hypothetical protein KUTeg_021833 [Tegillarca granosa]
MSKNVYQDIVLIVRMTTVQRWQICRKSRVYFHVRLARTRCYKTKYINYHQKMLSCGQFKDPQRTSRLLTENQIFATFKNIRGTPQYFKQMHLDMLAKLRQYGPYTFFISGSAANFIGQK